MTLLPTRCADILTRQTGSETVALDTAANTAHALSPMASSVFALCDGTATVESAAKTLSLSVTDVETAVITLTSLGLVAGPGMTRRRAMQRAGLVGAGALAVSIAAPLAAAHASTQIPLYLDGGGSGDGASYVAGSTFESPTTISFASPGPVTDDDTTATGVRPNQTVLQNVGYRPGGFTVAATGLSPSSTYTVRTYLVEPYYTTANSRVMTITTNLGTTGSVDIYATAGFNTVLIKELSATSDSNGALSVQFTASVDNPLYAAMEII